MMVYAYMLAFGEGELRPIEIPESQWEEACGAGSIVEALGLAYHYGQNEQQQREFPSVSIGDIIDVGGWLYIVRPMGFAPVCRREMADYKKLPRRERSFSPLARGRH